MAETRKPTNRNDTAAHSFNTALQVVFTLGALLLVFISFRLEEMAYLQILGDVGESRLVSGSMITVAQGAALGLSVMKIALVYVIAQRARSGLGSGAAAIALRILLVTLSLAASLLVIAGSTISPLAERNLTEAEDRIARRFDDAGTELRRRHREKIEDLRHQLGTRESQLNVRHHATLGDLTDKLDTERSIGGQNFRGARFRDLEARIDAEKRDYRTQLGDLRDGVANRIDIENASLAQRLEDLAGNRRAEIDALDFSAVFASDEAQNPFLFRAVSMVNAVLPEDAAASTVTAIIVFTLLLGLGIEIGPLIFLGFVFRTMGTVASDAPSRPDRRADSRAQAAHRVETGDTPSRPATVHPLGGVG